MELFSGQYSSQGHGVRYARWVRSPAGIQRGIVDSTRIIQMDIYPTLLELAGAPLRPDDHIDGVSLAPIMQSRGVIAKRPLYFHFPHYTHAQGPTSSIIDADNWKLIQYYNTYSGEFQLFNLNTDPFEIEDLVGLHPNKVQELKAKLDAYLVEVDAELPYPNPIYEGNPTKGKDFSYNRALSDRKSKEKRILEAN